MREMRTREVFARLEVLPRWILVLSSLVLTAILSIIDWITGRDVSFLIFYLGPIGLASWFAGARWGITVALLCGVVWYLEDVMGAASALSIYLILWNLATKGVFLVIISRLFSRLKVAMDNEARMARTDPLTGVANRRVLFEILDFEIKAMPRSGTPLSVAFIDLDNFKEVNDTIGHDAGDEVLRAVVRGIKSGVRSMDLVARVGGDEFVIMLPNADSGAAAEVALRVRHSVMDELALGQWQCNLSIGVVTCTTPPCDPDALLTRADRLMYQAKKAGKGRTLNEILKPGPGEAPKQ